MKKVFLFTIILASVVLFSCTKTVHKVRVTNNYIPGTTVDVTIGANAYGVVANGGTSNYMETPEGAAQTVTVKVTALGLTSTVPNTITVSGSGEHNWTLKLGVTNTTDMTFTLTEDK